MTALTSLRHYTDTRYENDYQNIGSFYELDMIRMPIAKKISEQMVSFSVKLHDNLKDHISNATFYNSYGRFLGLFDSIYLDMRDRYLGGIDEIEENAITRLNSDKVLFSFARGRERCDRNGHAVFLRPGVDFAITGSEITGISTSSTKLK